MTGAEGLGGRTSLNKKRVPTGTRFRFAWLFHACDIETTVKEEDKRAKVVVGEFDAFLDDLDLSALKRLRKAVEERLVGK